MEELWGAGGGCTPWARANKRVQGPCSPLSLPLLFFFSSLIDTKLGKHYNILNIVQDSGPDSN